MIKRSIAGVGFVAILAVGFTLTGCVSTETQKVESHLPAAIPTAYMLFYDKDSVSAADSESMLLEVVAAMTVSDNIKANINGFRGPDESVNQDALRAQAVLKFLVDHGVDPSRAIASPMGVAESVGKDDDGSARRRVEIFISPITPAKS